MTPLFIDIETAPDSDRSHLFELPQAPAELPDPEELLAGAIPDVEKLLGDCGAVLPEEYLDTLADCEAAGKKRAGVYKAITGARDAAGKLLTDLSVTPEYCRVVALGYAGPDDEPWAEVVGLPRYDIDTGEPADERFILSEFWRLARSRDLVLVGYNLLDFDLRVLLVRSALLGVAPTRIFDLKPWGKDCIDLMKARFPVGRAMKLKQLARLYGLPVPVEDVDGSMISDLVQTDPARVADYVRSDIEVTRSLYRFYAGYFFPAAGGGW